MFAATLSFFAHLSRAFVRRGRRASLLTAGGVLLLLLLGLGPGLESAQAQSFVRIAPVTPQIAEGQDAEFRLTLSTPASQRLVIELCVAHRGESWSSTRVGTGTGLPTNDANWIRCHTNEGETGDQQRTFINSRFQPYGVQPLANRFNVFASGYNPPTKVTVQAGQASAVLTIPTADDGVAESGISFILVALRVNRHNDYGSNYRVDRANPGGATDLAIGPFTFTLIEVRDNTAPSIFLTPENGVIIGGQYERVVEEPASGSTEVEFYVGATPAPSTSTVTARYDVFGAGGRENSDTTVVNLTFAPGDTRKTITVAIPADDETEGDEFFTVRRHSVRTSAGIFNIHGPRDAVIRVPANDHAVTIADASGDEGDTGIRFRVALSTMRTLAYEVRTRPGTAEDPRDYEARTATFTFPTRRGFFNFDVVPEDDFDSEGNETFFVDVIPVGSTTVVATATGIIEDNDFELNFASPTVEVAEDAGNAELVVNLLPPLTDEVTVDYASADGTAEGGSDYTAANGTLTFAIGETTQTISIAISDDTGEEPDTETFSVTLSNVSDDLIFINEGEATVTITDNDDPPTIRVANSSGAEDSTVVFNVTLSGTSDQTITVVYQTTDQTSGSNLAVAGTDYTAAMGVLTFMPGEAAADITVTTLANADDATQTFGLVLTSPMNASFPGSPPPTMLDVIGTITELPTLGLSADVSTVAEGGTVIFTVTLSAQLATTHGITLALATEQAGVDQTSFTANFGGTQPLAQQFTVTVDGNDRDGPDGSLTATLSLDSPAPAELRVGTSTITLPVTDDDDPPEFSAENETARETADHIVFTASLNAASDNTVTVAYSTGTAGTGSDPAEANDFDEATGTLTFAPGTTAQQLTVTINADGDDDNEEFTLTFSSLMNASFPSSASGGTYAVTGTITALPTLALDAAPATVDEGGTVVFTVTLSEAVSGSHQGTLELTPQNAVLSQSSFTPRFGGDEPLSQTFTVTVEDNDRDGPNGSINAVLNHSATDVIRAGLIIETVTVNDDDDPPLVSVSDSTGAEASTVQFNVTLSEASDHTVTVQYQTTSAPAGSGGTAAVAGTDYTATDGTLTIMPGQLGGSIEVTTLANTDDMEQLFGLQLSNPLFAAFAGSPAPTTVTATGTITERPVLALAVDQMAVDEGGTLVFTVSLSDAVGSTHGATLSLATENAGVDQSSFTLMFGGTEPQSQTFTVTVDDNDPDGPGGSITATLSLSAATDAIRVGTSTVTITVNDNDDPPEFSVADEQASETADNIVFTARLSEASDFTVTVAYTTGIAGSSSSMAEAEDFETASGTLTFAPRELEQRITVTISDDTDEDVDEFTLTFSSVMNASFPSSASGGSYAVTGTITERPALVLSADEAAVDEGDMVVFTVTLSEDVPTAHSGHAVSGGRDRHD